MKILCHYWHTVSSVLQNWDDQAHLVFVQSHLSEILELLVDPAQLLQSGQTSRDCQVCRQHYNKEINSEIIFFQNKQLNTSINSTKGS